MQRSTTPLTNLNSQSMVWLFPSFGVPHARSGDWSLRLCGAVFRPSVVKLPKRLQVRILQKAMKAPPDAYETPVFRERLMPFIAAPHRGRRLTFQIAGQTFTLPRKSRRNGHFRATLQVPSDVVSQNSDNDGWLDISTWREDGLEPTLGGRVQLLDHEGISVISDIDDTVKVTGVGCRRTLLANTFLNEFQSVPGMAECYRAWQAEGCAFHYVSSSPWQLFAPLDRWRSAAGLPEGGFHLRHFKLGDQLMRRLLRIRRHGKARVILQLARQFPRRRFVLIGDSSEHDPEIYGALARRLGASIAAIYIRQLPHNPLAIARSEKAFRGLPSEIWQAFESSNELPQSLATLATLGPAAPSLV